MKENKEKRRIPARTILLYLIVLTLLLIGVTLARYVTTGTGGDTARVAADGNVTLTQQTPDTHKVLPGVDIKMDPLAGFTGTEMDSYIFVKIEAPGWDYIATKGTLSLGNGQKPLLTMAPEKKVFQELEAGNGYMVLYTRVDAGDSLTKARIVKNGRIRVNEELTEGDMASTVKGMEDIRIQAWDVQAGGFSSPQEAWTSVTSN